MSTIENKFNCKFSVGDKIFAKIKGYPHWPAIITGIENDLKKMPKYNIKFYGTHETSLVTQDNICYYQENKKKYGIEKTNNFKNKKFNNALKEAESQILNFNPNSTDEILQNERKFGDLSVEEVLQKVNSRTCKDFSDVPKAPMTCTKSPCQQPETPKRQVISLLQELEEICETDTFSKPPLSEGAPPTATYQHRAEVLHNSLADIENSLIENNLLEDTNNEEDKLEMAAKIGSTLLEKIKLLEEKNLRLVATIASTEEKLEELEDNERKYISTIESLSQELHYSKLQLNKEKEFQVEMQNIFEEQDKKSQQMIDLNLKKIKNLEMTIATSQTINKLEKRVSSQHTKPTFTNNETQTETGPHCTSLHINCSSNMPVELAQLKSRQYSLECMVKDLAAQIQNNHSKEPPNSEIQSIINVPKQKTVRKHTPAKLSNTPSNGRKKNLFSVSLQVAKCKELQTQYSMDTQRPRQMTNNEPLKAGGVCQTPTGKLRISCVTQCVDRMTADQLIKTKEDCQTLTQQRERCTLKQLEERSAVPVGNSCTRITTIGKGTEQTSNKELLDSPIQPGHTMVVEAQIHRQDNCTQRKPTTNIKVPNQRHFLAIRPFKKIKLKQNYSTRIFVNSLHPANKHILNAKHLKLAQHHTTMA